MLLMTANPASLGTRPSLLFRLRDWGDAQSWAEFDQLYRRLVYGYAVRSGLRHEEAEEVAQDVFTRIAQTISSFEPQPAPGSFRAWLMNLTRWRVTDKFRARRGEPASPPPEWNRDRTQTIERIPDPGPADDVWTQEWREQLLTTAMSRIARRSRAKHFQVFELSIRQRWPVLRVSRELGVSPAAIYLINHRLAKLLQNEIAALEATLA